MEKGVTYYPMKKKDYRAALKEFELTQGRAGLLFGGITDRSGRRWAALGAPYYVALLIEIMRKYKLHPDDIEMLGARWRKK
jgi:hypothetical protein